MLFIPSRVIATCFALTSFTAAVSVGLYVGNPASTVLVRALLVMIVCWCVGLGLAGVAQRAIDAHLEDYKRRNPLPDSTDQANPDHQGEEQSVDVETSTTQAQTAPETQAVGS